MGLTKWRLTRCEPRQPHCIRDLLCQKSALFRGVCGAANTWFILFLLSNPSGIKGRLLKIVVVAAVVVVVVLLINVILVVFEVIYVVVVFVVIIFAIVVFVVAMSSCRVSFDLVLMLFFAANELLLF